MKRNTRICLSTLACMSAVVAVYGVFALQNNQKAMDAHAENEIFSLTFNDSTNIFTTSSTYVSGSANANTARGNPISFSYVNIKASDSGWQTLKPGGYLYNTTPVHGIISILVVMSGGLRVDYGWSSNVATYTEDLTSNTTSALSNRYPPYFTIYNNQLVDVTITSMYVVYSCNITSDPGI